MERVLLIVAAGAIAALVTTVTTRDSGEPLAVLTVVLAAAVATGALSAAAGMQLAAARTRRGRPPARARRVSLRRGAEIGGALGFIALLRAIDGLTLLTGSFIVLAFIAAEAVVSARRA